MINEVLADTEERMQRAVDALRSDLTTISTGRATPALVDRMMIDYYGTPTPLQQLATITVPEPQVLAIRPYGASDIPAIEKAIAQSDLNFNPNNDGQVIHIKIPALSEERRKELNKLVSNISSFSTLKVLLGKKLNFSDLIAKS